MKIRLLLTATLLLLGLNLAVGLRVFGAANPASAEEDNGYDNIAVLTRAMQLIRQDYFDEKRRTTGR